jgi:DNA invertase Pin-like site-specific DNA recombinase
MKTTLIGYARCSTDKQDLSAQRQALLELGVVEDRIYTDHGLTGTNRARPSLAAPSLPECAAEAFRRP